MNNADPRRSPLSPQLRVPPSGRQEPSPGDPENRLVDPPWETDTGRLPARSESAPADRNVESGIWRWDAALEQSYAGVSIDNMTGTGKMPAMVPLSPHDSWSKGLRAPGNVAQAAAPAPAEAGAWAPEVEVDEQPSAQMRALRVGNLARAAAISWLAARFGLPLA